MVRNYGVQIFRVNSVTKSVPCLLMKLKEVKMTQPCSIIHVSANLSSINIAPDKVTITALNKMRFFNPEVLIFFLLLHDNICCGYSLEGPHGGPSNEYPQHMFLWRNKKIFT